MSIPKSFQDRRTFTKEDGVGGAGDEFSVLTYNLLAACHVQRWDYSYTKADPITLELSYRHNIRMKEIAHLNNDIICFQEVGPAYWKETLETEMNRLGYTGLFVRRKEDSDYYDEGCATFWKEAKFALEDKAVFYLGDEAGKILDNLDNSDDPELSTMLKTRYVDRPDVLLVTKLRSVLTREVVVVANTHIIWGSEPLTDVRALQCRCSKFALSQYLGDTPNCCVYCGDFNSVPQSLAYILSQGKHAGYDFEKTLIPAFDGQKLLPVFKRLIQSFPADDLPLQSAYKTCVGKEPPLTHFDNAVPFTFDYIFYGSKSSGKPLTCLSVVDIPEAEKWTGTLPPDDHFPSDHLPVTSRFKF
ncbi:uncharacterized protein LOC132549574 [Ylistrum balloti]|uniref:uncharacterized protein LOC132549574 n=1 Tax=Ylistrum balloti TaxID=509963 RepID=UPI002905F595|nr:uncharacterized protein LOC132549574 [Ylistrum balloti]XP_060069496.1 uncharacterized protein LOC132549574 [Ylistrum balloti]